MMHTAELLYEQRRLSYRPCFICIKPFLEYEISDVPGDKSTVVAFEMLGITACVCCMHDLLSRNRLHV